MSEGKKPVVWRNWSRLLLAGYTTPLWLAPTLVVWARPTNLVDWVGALSFATIAVAVVMAMILALVSLLRGEPVTLEAAAITTATPQPQEATFSGPGGDYATMNDFLAAQP